MGELVNSTYLSLDGVIEHPETWPATGGFGEEGNRIQTELVEQSSAVLMGRRTYESFAAVWPTLSGPLAEKMNAMPKYVVSTTLTDPSWTNTHIIDEDLEARVRQLKAEAEGGLVQFGFGPVARSLMAAGLMDRLRLWLHPFFIGQGGLQDLLHRDAPEARFTLEDTVALESGIVVLDYRVKTQD